MKKILYIGLLTTWILQADVLKGDMAPNFTLPSLNSVSNNTLKAHKGEVILLNLWASWCKGCKKEMPEFVKLQKTYKHGFKVVAVSLDNDKTKAQNFIQTLGKTVPFDVLYDKEKKLAKSYGCEAMPSSFLIDKQGKVIATFVGSFDSNDIAQLKTKINQLK